ncbi:phage tail protein [Furfurilactobacillus siliginis]|uniref:Tail protein n=1 Tax=Furfurilactobacillus siliginis TaxID=348151 RepID=A0A0R2LFL7_9LACO|nr:phage tail protein [Furfurilactobacillus siliginis]KRN96852.1 phage major tail protein [Furfurilactobacillus siliginis]GEK28520.1 tail protein [Furfurilactobacillus siliginis]
MAEEKAGSTSFHGIQWITFGILDETGKLIADATKGVSGDGIYLVDGDGQGATTANVTGLETKGTPQWANNKIKRQTHGKMAPEVAITMLDMPFKLLQKLKGYVTDGKGGWVLSSANKPHVAMLIKSTGFDGEDYFEGFANGELIEPGHTHGTDTTNETDANTALTYSALVPIDNKIFVDDKGNQQPMKMWASTDEGFEEESMYSEVFGGFKPNAGDNVSNSSSATDHTTTVPNGAAS